MSRTRRAPTADELRLWAEVAKTVAPLGGVRPIEPPPEEKPREPPKLPDVRPEPRIAPRPTAAALASIERRTVSRLARGRIELDGRLDLHGMTQSVAHGRLIRFLKEAQLDDARLVLVITGKGKPATETGVEERGVLRRAVPLWLSSAEMRQFVVGFGESAPPHGGAGALYVRIRRARG